MTLKEDVLEHIEENGPIGLDGVAKGLYDGEVACPCCNRTHTEYESFRDEVGEAIRYLTDRNHIYVNAEWEYRTVK